MISKQECYGWLVDKRSSHYTSYFNIYLQLFGEKTSQTKKTTKNT